MNYSFQRRMMMRLLTLLTVAFTMVSAASAQWADIYVYSPEWGSQYEAPGYISIYYELMEPKELSSIGGSVLIEYTTDDGESWNEIASGVDPFETYYEWYVPSDITLSDNYYIRISEQLPSPKYDPIHYEGWSGRFEIFRSCIPPTIWTQPLTQSACSGSTVTLSVQSSAQSATYVWYKNSAIIEQTRQNYHNIFNAAATDAGTYSVTIVEDCGEQMMSANASLSIVASPTISSNPPSTLQFCDQSSTTLGVSATGFGITFQWRHDGQNILGANDSLLFLDPLTPSSNGVYDVVVSGVCQPSATSTPTTISVISRPIITQDIDGLVLCPNSSGQITINATGSNLSYQWFRNGLRIASDGGPSLTVSNASEATTGTYHVVVTSGGVNPQGCPSTAVSRDVQVSTLQAPTILTQPTTVDACIASRTELVVVAEGFALNYQWTKNGLPIANSNTHALVLDNANASTAGTYSVRVTGSCGLSVTSAPIQVRAFGEPSFVQQPASITVQVGERIELSASATESSSVQWNRNSIPIIGATSWSYVVESSTIANAGIYTAIASNVCGSRVSSQARVLVRDPNVLLPELTLSPTSVGFGDVPVGYTKVMTLANLMTNTGNAPLIVQSLAISGAGYSIQNAPTTPFTLQPNETAAVSIQVASSGVGTIIGTLSITSNAPIPVEEVSLTANGVQHLTHNPALDYAVVAVNTAKEMCISVTNTSGATATIEQLSVQGLDAAMFSIVTTTPLDVPAGESRDLCVRFTPTATGALAAQLSILSATAGNSTVALQGTGDATSGVDDNVASLMALHPNPSSGAVTLRLTDFPATRIDIVSVTGVVVRSMNVYAQDSNVITWDGVDAGGSPVASGAYHVIVYGANRVISMPLSIIR